MKFNKTVEPTGDHPFALIGKGVDVTGDILFTDGLRIEGRTAGRLISEGGTLIIEEGARVEAQVDVGICLVSGIVEGNISAKSRVEVHKSARVRGDLTTPVLLVEEGAVLNGTVGMGKQVGNSLSEPAQLNDSEGQARVTGA